MKLFIRNAYKKKICYIINIINIIIIIDIISKFVQINAQFIKNKKNDLFTVDYDFRSISFFADR